MLQAPKQIVLVTTCPHCFESYEFPIEKTKAKSMNKEFKAGASVVGISMRGKCFRCGGEVVMVLTKKEFGSVIELFRVQDPKHPTGPDVIPKVLMGKITNV